MKTTKTWICETEGDTWIRWSWWRGEKNKHVQPKIRPSTTLSVTSHSRDWEITRYRQSCGTLLPVSARIDGPYFQLAWARALTLMRSSSRWPYRTPASPELPSVPLPSLCNRDTLAHSAIHQCIFWGSKWLSLISLSVCLQCLQCFGFALRSSHGRRS